MPAAAAWKSAAPCWPLAISDTATATTITPKNAGSGIHGIATAAQAASVAASDGRNGSIAPTARASRAYSTKASAVTTRATTSSWMDDSHHTSARAPSASARPLTRRVMDGGRVSVAYLAPAAIGTDAMPP